MGSQAPPKARSPDATAPAAGHRAGSGAGTERGEDRAVDARWAARVSPALLDEQLPAPLYHQIYLVLRGLIGEGGFGKEGLLPGEQSLAQMFSVSRITVKRALNELAADKLVTRHRGRGTLITAKAAVPVVRSSFDNLIESLEEMGLVTTVELLGVAEVRAGEAGVATAMEVADDAPMQRAVRRRILEGEPLSYLVSYTPMQIATRYSEVDLAGTPFLKLLERAGAAVKEAEQWITAVAAEPQVASALGVDAAAPLLKIERVMRDAQGATVQLIHGFYRPDRFQYHVRNSDGAGRNSVAAGA